jgi:hypothetical protein
MTSQRAVRIARKIIRARVRTQRFFAAGLGNGVVYDQCTAWLADEQKQLYPVSEVPKTSTKLDGRYQLLNSGAGWFVCLHCNVGGLLFACGDCLEVTCIDCDCKCFRDGAEIVPS